MADITHGALFDGLSSTRQKPKPSEVERHAPLGCITRKGKSLHTYGFMRVSGETVSAHRLVHAIATGQPIRDGLHVHHRCGNRGCINPAHLVELTPAEHMHSHAVFVMKLRSSEEFGTPAPVWINKA